MEVLLNKEVILWDFDGVILDSSKVRENGFIKVLSDYPKDKVKQLIEFHRENGGLSRYVKFEYFFKEILKIEFTNLLLDNLAKEFSVIMRQTLDNKNLLIEEVIKYIASNYERYTMHIVSGSDGAELKYLCQELGINQYFRSIHGSPTPKNKIVKDLIRREQYKREIICLIGDSINDFHAAQYNDIDFLGYNNNSLKALESNYITNF